MPEKFIFTQSDGDGATKVIEVTANDAKSAAWAFHDFCRDGYKETHNVRILTMEYYDV